MTLAALLARPPKNMGGAALNHARAGLQEKGGRRAIGLYSLPFGRQTILKVGTTRK